MRTNSPLSTPLHFARIPVPEGRGVLRRPFCQTDRCIRRVTAFEQPCQQPLNLLAGEKYVVFEKADEARDEQCD
jgi:hypothetical protein